MLSYVDESGHPHPKDQNLFSALVAVCIDESVSRLWTSEVYELKRTFRPTNPTAELKAVQLLNRSTFRNKPQLKELVEQVVNLCLYQPVIILAVIMPRPKNSPNVPEGFLPIQHRFLLQRINALTAKNDDRAIVVFDEGGPSVKGGVEPRFTNFMMRTVEGRSFRRILETPFSVKSESQIGIQLADLFAGIIRLYHQNRLRGGAPPGDEFLWAIKRYYDIIDKKTLDLEDSSGRHLFGFYEMPERLFYVTPEQADVHEDDAGDGELRQDDDANE